MREQVVVDKGKWQRRIKDSELPDETVGPLIREKLKELKQIITYNEEWEKVYALAVPVSWIDDAEIREEMCFKI